MSYDNSELLRNYLHGWQVTLNPFLRETAEGIVNWVNETLSDQSEGGFYASQDADYSLDDDGDYFTWTLDELRAALPPVQTRVMELYYDVEAHGEMHHNPAKNVLWIARDVREIAKTLSLEEASVRLAISSAKEKMFSVRKERPTPYIDRTMYVSWNAMFVSAYLSAATVFGGSLGGGCHRFALKTLDRMLRETWSESRGFSHRMGGPVLEGSLDDQVFGVIALLDAYESTLDPRYFDAAKRTLDNTIDRYGDAEGGGFFDRPHDAAPMGGLEVRRKPFQDSPTPGANSIAAIALVRMHAYTGDARYYDFAQKTLEAFAGIAPQYGMFAATYGLAATLFAHHPTQVVVTGLANDPVAHALEGAAHRVYRLGKAVLRIAPGFALTESAARVERDAASSVHRQSDRDRLHRPNLHAADERSNAAHRTCSKTAPPARPRSKIVIPKKRGGAKIAPPLQRFVRTQHCCAPCPRDFRLLLRPRLRRHQSRHAVIHHELPIMLARVLDQPVREVVHRRHLSVPGVHDFHHPFVALRLDRHAPVLDALLHERHDLRLRLQLIALWIIRIPRLLPVHHISEEIHRCRRVNQLRRKRPLRRRRLELILIFRKIFRHRRQFASDVVPLIEHQLRRTFRRWRRCCFGRRRCHLPALPQSRRHIQNYEPQAQNRFLHRFSPFDLTHLATQKSLIPTCIRIGRTNVDLEWPAIDRSARHAAAMLRTNPGRVTQLPPTHPQLRSPAGQRSDMLK